VSVEDGKDDVATAKRELRARIIAWRNTLTAVQRAEAGAALSQHGLAFLGPRAPGTVVSGFASLSDELDCMPLLRRLAGEGFQLALPIVQGKGRPLMFRAWAPGDQMDAGVWDIPQPKADKAELAPDVLLVPLLAFDRAGWRLGYGGGFYDRTLRALRADKTIVAVGLAYDQQLVDAVPHLDYDEQLDWVLTPSGPTRCSR
jgi:5-formyltetrahydrofolate cyclo-ligase